MSTLVAAFGDLEGAEIPGAVLAIVALGAAIAGLGYLMLSIGVPATAGLMAFGGAMLMIGAGAFVAALGVSKLVASFAGMDAGSILAIGESLLGVSLATLALTAAITVLALNPWSGRGIRKLGKMLEEVREQIDLLDAKKVESFATVLSSLAQLATMSLAGTGVPAFISEIVEALDEIPNDTTKMVNLSTTADSLTNLMRVSATVEEAQLANIKMIIEGVSNPEGNENVGKLVNTLSSMFGAQDGEQGSAARKIVIELDGNKLGEFIDKRENAKARRYAHFTR